MKLPDVQGERPEFQIKLTKVGIVGVKVPVGQILLGQTKVILAPTISAYIDLPSNQRGIHASRNYEPIIDAINKYVGGTYKLEDLVSSIAKKLLKKHPYSTYSLVKAVTTAFYQVRTPNSNSESCEPFRILAKAEGIRTEDEMVKVDKFIGVRVLGMTACPCALEIIKETFKDRVKNMPQNIPLATHVQRSYATIIIQVPDGFEIDVMDLVGIARESMSSPTYELLKRSDEANIIINAVEKPRFVEDCVRYMANCIVSKFSNFPDSTLIYLKQRSQESVHTHDLQAELRTTIGEIRSYDLTKQVRTR